MKTILPLRKDIEKRFLEVYNQGKKPYLAVERQIAEEFGMVPRTVQTYLKTLKKVVVPPSQADDLIEGFEDWMVERAVDLTDSIDTPGLDESLRDDVKILFRLARRLGQLEGQRIPIPEKYQQIIDIFEAGDLYD
jgi:hypothetical protein